jgi:hypothetical protein
MSALTAGPVYFRCDREVKAAGRAFVAPESGEEEDRRIGQLPLRWRIQAAGYRAALNQAAGDPLSVSVAR